MENNKSRFITPGVMLFAGALAMIIMLIKKYDLYRMLWTLLIVLIIFYIIGDIARYIYSTIRPRVIPATLDLENMEKQAEQRINEADDNIEYLDDDFEDFGSMKKDAAKANERKPDEEKTADTAQADDVEDDTEEYGYSDEDLAQKE